jgi:hypothetical protein
MLLLIFVMILLSLVEPHKSSRFVVFSYQKSHLIVFSSQVAPSESARLSWSLVPLECGQLPLPHVSITWERNSASIVEFGTHTIPRQLFVRPVARGGL